MYCSVHVIMILVLSSIVMMGIIYFHCVQGFILNCSFDSVAAIGDHAAKENKCFMMNIGAPYLCFRFKVLETFFLLLIKRLYDLKKWCLNKYSRVILIFKQQRAQFFEF